MSPVPERGSQRRPRLVFAAVDLAPGSGGIAELSRQTLEVLLGLKRERHIELRVHVLEGAGADDDAALRAAAPVCDLQWHSGQRRHFARALLTSRADLLLFDHAGIARTVAWLPRLLRPRYGLMIHGVEIWHSGRADYLRTARRARFLLANSAYTRDKALACCPDLPPISVCWPGRDRGAVVAVPGDVELGPHALLIVGRLDTDQRHKGHDALIDAMAGVVDAVPDAQLLIVGSGSDRPRLEAKARALGLAHCVLFSGWVSAAQLDDLYARSALFVMPSSGDGFGLVYLEAMMRGLPCVGLQSGSAAEVLEQGRAGFLVDDLQPEPLAARLVKLLRDAPLRQRVGQAGLTRYRSHFTGRHHAARLRAELLERLASDGATGRRAAGATRQTV